MLTQTNLAKAKKLYAALKQKPATEAHLLKWVSLVTGFSLATVNVCPNHQPPAQVLCDLYFNKVTDAIVLGPRGGGKTVICSIIYLVLQFFNPGYEAIHFGATDNQSKRCYNYYTKFLKHPNLKKRILKNPKIRETNWVDGGQLQILPGTKNQAQGGHPNIVGFDEIESADPEAVELSKSMPETYKNNGHTKLGISLGLSTRNSQYGPMQRAIKEAQDRGASVYSFCILETIDGSTCEQTMCSTCPIYEYCEGRALKANGHRSRDEILAIFNRVSKETWEAQHLCRKPNAGSLVLGNFSEEDNVSAIAEFDPLRQYIWIFYDWGFTDIAAFLFCQYQDGRLYIFHEMSGNETTEQEWLDKIVVFLVNLPSYDGPDLVTIREMLDNQGYINREVWDSLPIAAAGDPSAVQMRDTFRKYGIPVASADQTKHRVLEGIDITRAVIKSAEGIIRLYVHPNCTKFVESIFGYSAQKLSDGSYTNKPDPKPKNHNFSHFPDALRYGVYRFRKLFNKGLVRPMRTELNIEKPEMHEILQKIF